MEVIKSWIIPHTTPLTYNVESQRDMKLSLREREMKIQTGSLVMLSFVFVVAASRVGGVERRVAYTGNKQSE